MAKKIRTTLIAIVALVGAWALVENLLPEKTYANLEEFAQCLTDKGAVMYGAYWCSHCQNEKAAFGDSFKHISYVECTESSEKCEANNVRMYPTWILADNRYEGEQGIKKLSEASGCLVN